MRHFKLFVVLVFLTNLSFGLPYATISLITDKGVKSSKSLHFSISNATSTIHDFTFDKFSKNGWYSNTNLYQYTGDIGTGQHKLNIEFKTDKEQNISDSLFIDGAISRVEIFIFISTNDSVGDFVKEIKILKYQTNSNYIKFSFVDTPAIGSTAAFNIENIGDKVIYGYPNKAFFFGSLYQEIHNGAWTQHYPLYIDIKYCDTIAMARPLKMGESVKAWTPNNDDCSEYKFIKEGNYYFQLLYTTTNNNIVFHGVTKLNRVDIHRQIFKFKL